MDVVMEMHQIGDAEMYGRRERKRLFRHDTFGFLFLPIRALSCHLFAQHMSSVLKVYAHHILAQPKRPRTHGKDRTWRVKRNIEYATATFGRRNGGRSTYCMCIFKKRILGKPHWNILFLHALVASS